MKTAHVLALALCAGCSSDLSTSQDALVAVEFDGWSLSGLEAGQELGASVSWAGDVDGDGIGDLLVGAPGDTAGAGMALLFAGAAGGPSSLEFWQVNGGPGDDLGRAVSGAGDVNGDGYDDVLVGAPAAADGGSISLFFGGPFGPSTTPDWTATGGQADARLGQAVVGLGDVDGDGYSDFAAAASLFDGLAGADVGEVRLWFGGAGGPGSGPDWSVEGEDPGGGFGFDLAGGDTDGDGRAELLITAPYENTFSGADSGAVRLYAGDQSGLSLTLPLAGEAGDWFGWSGSIADLTGDGYGDVVIGVRNGAGFHSRTGRVDLHPGGPSGATAGATWSYSGSNNYGHWGVGLAAPGDVNGDGWADLAMGDRHGSASNGRFNLLLGHEGAPSAEPDVQHQPYALDWYARVLEPAGDVTGDGLSDVLVGSVWDTNALGLVELAASSAPLPGDTPDTVLFGGSDGAFMYSLPKSVGDVDADGYDDLLVGTTNATGAAGLLAGRVTLHMGSETGLETAASWSYEGDAEEHFGAGLSFGDLNGDGFADAAIGGSFTGSTQPGRVRVFLGGPSGLDVAPLWEAQGVVADDRFGTTLDWGDVDGDRYDELVVGAYYHTDSELNQGAAYLFGSDGATLSAAPIWSGTGVEETEYFGVDVALGGDVNGDGFADMMIGAPRRATGWTDQAGVVHVFPGSATGVSASPSLVIEYPNYYSHWFGAHVSHGGDLDGDGYGDLVVGEPSGSSNEGRAHVYWGSSAGLSMSDESVLDVYSPYSSKTGSALCGGDVDGDGLMDLVVGQQNSNTAFLFLGGSHRFVGQQSAWSYTGQAGSFFAANDSACGDHDGDGRADISVGAYRADAAWTDEGSISIFHAARGDGVAPARAPNLRLRQATTGAPLGAGALSETVGADVVMFLRAPWGRANGRLEVEAKPAGTAFDGTGLVLGEWTDTGLGGIETTVLLDGLISASGYRVRARAAWHPADRPRVRTGRWIALGRGDVDVWTSADSDLDGDPDGTDCAPLDPLIFTGAAEVCDGVDHDCDGDPNSVFDGDSDGFVDADEPDCAALGGDLDCDDDDPTAYPGATEICDGVDQDCDGTEDNGFDADGDGAVDEVACAALGGDLDCNDDDSTVAPGAVELCDDIDSDCDGDLVDGFTDTDASLASGSDGLPDCIDIDDDNDGDPDTTDCQSLNPEVFSGAPESCDDVDSNCNNSLVDAALDVDADGLPDCVDDDDDNDGSLDVDDCEPGLAAIHPGALELCDTIDQDCDGDVVESFDDLDGDGVPSCVDPDVDGDGFVFGDGPADDCDDLDAATHPGAIEACDGNDNDCDGAPGADEDDDDLDGVRVCEGDCDDADSSIAPGLPELCNGVDDDCVDGPDDGLGTADWFADVDGDGFGGAVSPHPANPLCEQPSGSWVQNGEDCDDSNSAVNPASPEVCNDVDDDCSGLPDDGLTMTEWFEDRDLDGWGDGGRGHPDNPLCTPPGSGWTQQSGDCDDLDGGVSPDSPEVCNGIDDDCDGEADDDLPLFRWYPDIDQDGYGHPLGGTADELCGPPLFGDWANNPDDCDDLEPAAHPGGQEVEGNSIDEDCDGSAAASIDDERVVAPGISCSAAAGGGWLLLPLLLVRRRR